MSEKENWIELDEETERLVKLGCEQLNMTREQFVEEAVMHLARKHGVRTK